MYVRVQECVYVCQSVSVGSKTRGPEIKIKTKIRQSKIKIEIKIRYVRDQDQEHA